MRAESDVVIIIDGNPLGKPNDHRTVRRWLPRADKHLQVAGAGNEDAAKDGPVVQRYRQGNRATVVDRRQAELIKEATTKIRITLRQKFPQLARAVEIQRLECFAPVANQRHEGDLSAIVQRRIIKGDERAGGDTRRIAADQRDGLEVAVLGQEDALSRLAGTDRGIERDSARVIQCRHRVASELRQNAAAGNVVANGRNLREFTFATQEDALRGLVAQDAGVERHLSLGIDRRYNRLCCDIKSVEY